VRYVRVGSINSNRGMLGQPTAVPVYFFDGA